MFILKSFLNLFSFPWLAANSIIPSKCFFWAVISDCRARFIPTIHFMNICLQRVKHYCIVILKGGRCLKYLPTAMTCENFAHLAGLLGRQKADTKLSQAFISTGTKQKSGKDTSQCLKTEKVHRHFQVVETTWLGTKWVHSPGLQTLSKGAWQVQGGRVWEHGRLLSPCRNSLRSSWLF